jgi:elongation factor P--(R)-beta-lysine ligase
LSDRQWRPTASISALRQRAHLLATARTFFAEHQVLEVDTPHLVSSTVTDVQIASFAVEAAGRYLHTSPEYAMKRLLAEGSGDIYQICKVYRAEAGSRLHNPEFTLVEWYRADFNLSQIMHETAALTNALLQSAGLAPRALHPITYADAFMQALGIDPLLASTDSLAGHSRQLGLAHDSVASSTRDDLLDFLMATVVGPTLGRDRLTVVHHYPASQASLAMLDAADPRTALRFELYCQGIELANGFVELADAAEQRLRFEADIEARTRRQLAAPLPDERLLAALAQGLPPCAGVALGFDRVAMICLGASAIDQVIAFPWERA